MSTVLQGKTFIPCVCIDCVPLKEPHHFTGQGPDLKHIQVR